MKTAHVLTGYMLDIFNYPEFGVIKTCAGSAAINIAFPAFKSTFWCKYLLKTGKKARASIIPCAPTKKRGITQPRVIPQR